MNLHPYAGRIMFSLAVIGLGILSLIFQELVIGRPPGWNDGPSESFLRSVLPGVLLLVCGVCIITNIAGRAAALSLIILLAFSCVLHVMNFADWVNGFKTFAMLGGVLVVWVRIEKDDEEHLLTERASSIVMYVGCILLAAFFIAAGYAHFIFATFVKDLIPSFIPFRLFWTYFCAICLFAGGIGILIPRTRPIASLLSGIMVFGWFLLLHIPRFIANPNDPSDRLGVMESLMLAGVFFVLYSLSSRKAMSYA
jgi:uncharacterized membrane protein YphA (DoxX/SURF4 family)